MKIFSFATSVNDTSGTLMVYSGAWGKLIHKNKKLKIS
jgi:hypothetical protein